ncbi:LysE family translocator [Vibrio europaeus]|uniref:LysE family translocator n=1 Tax=Vibrio europaeus TaxID=300876 RepID=A0A178J9T8_9VIBR|nr:LysE family translocator [Vibrio europaeus]MDC5707462.1 LysE family translocator [Vibrio europaeus]MDC5711059.1 LysE family translocator [Vibrio europaeus]MDC5716218.1 LysE family translocator [Vibrio europaeus]MDC5719276.1 LysE family translocator [Vibrio europaeus]MDC5725517.1 LysE family translocator [Vibrio europaeus]
MNEITILTTLAVVHFVALMSPGPDFALVVQNATRYGRQTGLYIALGLSCGILLHSILSLTGVSYLVHQQPTLFALLQLAGGSYLFYLGYGALKASWSSFRSRNVENESSKETGLLLNNKREAFSRGFATNILNPKALVFFVSLMSSLVPASMSLTGKGMALMILWSISLLWFSFLAWALSTQRMQRKIKATAHYVDGLCGILFTVLGLGILWQSTTAIITLF